MLQMREELGRPRLARRVNNKDGRVKVRQRLEFRESVQVERVLRL